MWVDYERVHCILRQLCHQGHNTYKACHHDSNDHPKFQANEIECCVYKVLNQQFFVSQSVVVVAYWTVHRMARAAGHWSTKYRISVLVKPRSGLLSKSSEKKIRRRWFDHKYDVYNLNINLSRDGRRWHPIHRQQAGSLTVRKISC